MVFIALHIRVAIAAGDVCQNICGVASMTILRSMSLFDKYMFNFTYNTIKACNVSVLGDTLACAT